MFSFLFRKDAAVAVAHIKPGTKIMVGGQLAQVVLMGHVHTVRMLDGTEVASATARPDDGRKFAHVKEGNHAAKSVLSTD